MTSRWFWLLVAMSSPAAGQHISVRSPLAVSPKAERALHEIAEPVEAEVPAGISPLDVARNLCGRVSATYEELLAEANESRSLSPTLESTSFLFPACFIRAKLSVRPLEGETLAGFSKRVVGVAGDKGVASIVAANGQLQAEIASTNGSASSIELATDRLLTVPDATETASYRVRTGAVGDLTAAIDRLKILVGPTGGPEDIDLSRELRLESDVSAPVGGNDLGCGAQRPPIADAAWPFDRLALVAALKANDGIRKARGLLEIPEPTIVAVADNGVQGLFEFFPREVLAINGREVPSDNDDNDDNGWIDDVTGASIFYPAEPPVAQKGKDPWHGTHLAGLVLGGSQYPATLSSNGVTPRIKLLPISLIERETVAVPGSGNKTRYRLPIGGVEDAIEYATDRNAFVINLSVSTRDNLSSLHGQLSRIDAVLVAAAGNQGNLYDANPLYPAGWGGKQHESLPVPVVSVAAHDKRGCLASFSGRGSERIDLAAPGVDISSFDLDGQQRVVSGTSQATAIVSFAAGLLHAEGLGDPLAIKRRLLASADFEPGLRENVYLGATLNILKAVSLFEDVIELRNEPRRLYRGTITPPLTLEMLCPDLASLSGTVMKIIPGADGRISVLVRWTSNNHVQERVCSPTISGFSFQDGSRFEFADLLDVVPRN